MPSRPLFRNGIRPGPSFLLKRSIARPALSAPSGSFASAVAMSSITSPVGRTLPVASTALIPRRCIALLNASGPRSAADKASIWLCSPFLIISVCRLVAFLRICSSLVFLLFRASSSVCCASRNCRLRVLRSLSKRLRKARVASSSW